MLIQQVNSVLSLSNQGNQIPGTDTRMGQFAQNGISQETGTPSALHTKLMQTLSVNRVTLPDNVKVEFAQDEPSNRVWINVVNATTGEVVFKFPPETIRLLTQYNQANGLTTDVRA